MGKIIVWIKEHRREFILLSAILLVGAFVRLYKIDQYMTFLGDEGRDVIIVRRLLIEHHPPLIGPGTSIGNMYLGPLYYYMMAIPLWVANYNPVGPAIFIALLGVATIFFVWYVANEWFGKRAAGVAALLYAISPVIIIYSRSSWNPNIMPFFALLTVYGMWRVWVKHQLGWIVIVGIGFASVLQSHYLGLLLLPVILILWFLTLLKLKSRKRFFVYSTISLILFLALMSPLVFFDLRHNFINFNAMKAFFSDRQTTVSVVPWKAIPGMWPILNNITADLVGAKNIGLGFVVAGVIVAAFLYSFFVRKEKYDFGKLSNVLVLTLWLGFGLIGLALYKQHIYDHYFGFVFAVPFIVIGGVINKMYGKNRILNILIIFFLAEIVLFDLQNLPINFSPNRQLERAMFVAKKVEEVSGNKRFNFALIADNNYDSAYRYFLNIDGAKVVDIDPQNTKASITDQLIVVCERERAKCDPTHNPKAEVANFGWTKIDAEYNNVFGVTIYKLGHAR